MIYDPRCFPFLKSLALALVLLILSACQPKEIRIGPAKSEAPNTLPLTLGPISYFENHCARCHGSGGSFYGDDFARNLKHDSDLYHFVEEMAAGPGGAPLQDVNLEAQVAWHRSLVDKRPFLAWTGWSLFSLQGEITPESTVELHLGKTRIPAQVKGHTWTILLEPGTSNLDILNKGSLVAEKNSQQTLLRLSESAFSHNQPLPDK